MGEIISTVITSILKLRGLNFNLAHGPGKGINAIQKYREVNDYDVTAMRCRN